MNALCFIPARGGSKRLPRKNLALLAGKPLLAYTVEAAQNSGVFSQIVVSSDDPETLALATRLGATADQRPEELAGDRIPFVRALEEYLLREKIDAEIVAGLQPTCPFRTSYDIRNAIALLRASGESAFVISVSEFEVNPQFALDVAEDGHRAAPRHPEAYRHSTQSQAHAKAWYPNGAIYLAHTAAFLAAHSFYGEPLFAYRMPPERAFDIDYPHQLAIAECMMQQQRPPSLS